MGTPSDSGSAPAGGAIDGERFSIEPGKLWKGACGRGVWWWQATFDEPRAIDVILQINGDHAGTFANAARSYVWQSSLDGRTWQDVEGTEVRSERRLFRAHRRARPFN